MVSAQPSDHSARPGADYWRAGRSSDTVSVACTVATTETEFLASLEPAPEVILSDHSLPVFSVPRVLTLLQERGLDIPVIVVTGTAGEEKAAEYLELGAADYFSKDNIGRLSETVTQAISKQRLKKERAARAGKLE